MFTEVLVHWLLGTMAPGIDTITLLYHVGSFSISAMLTWLIGTDKMAPAILLATASPYDREKARSAAKWRRIFIWHLLFGWIAYVITILALVLPHVLHGVASFGRIIWMFAQVLSEIPSGLIEIVRQFGTLLTLWRTSGPIVSALASGEKKALRLNPNPTPTQRMAVTDEDIVARLGLDNADVQRYTAGIADHDDRDAVRAALLESYEQP